MVTIRMSSVTQCGSGTGSSVSDYHLHVVLPAKRGGNGNEGIRRYEICHCGGGKMRKRGNCGDHKNRYNVPR